jgi:3-hydroxyisobutyrate dehydrogenase-like beta-hydroxyacid dehydrogenase
VALLDLFWTSMAGLVHALAFARADNIAAADLSPYALNISGLMTAIIPKFASHVDSGRHPEADSNVTSALSAITHIAEAAEMRGIDPSVMRAAKPVAERAVAAGHGGDGFSRLVDFFSTWSNRE